MEKDNRKEANSSLLAECQKEFLFNRRYIPNLSMPSQYCNDYETFPKKTKYLCKHTGKTMICQIWDEMCVEDYEKISKYELNCMLNEICKDCEYYDFF